MLTLTYSKNTLADGDEKWGGCCAQTLVVNNLKSMRWSAASGLPQGLVLQTAFLSLTHLSGGIEYTPVYR